MDLQILWFILIAVLFAVFFLLEGFDYGVGMLMPFLGKSREDRNKLSHTIGPFWDGNEVWMLTAGGALFAAFPEVYATMFSGYYSALVLMLFGLIIRGVGLELRGKATSPAMEKRFELMFTAGSLLAALLWGVVAVNLVLGIPIGPDKQYAGSFFDLLDPRSLLGGVAAVFLAVLHGALFTAVRNPGEHPEDLGIRAMGLARKVWPITLGLMIATVAWVLFTVHIPGTTWMGVTAGMIAGFGLVISIVFINQGMPGLAFIGTGLCILLGTLSIFSLIFPNLIVSSIDPAYSLNIRNSSSSNYTLTIMSVTAMIMVPIVIAYQIFFYRFFMKKGV